mmetsp:Transcript_40742/g.75422  ORF Transcript_40742/g.75422 Transcript_40742/m.75422 type:complete len:101 (-) Transcript_40742:19-321(-)
MLRLISKPVDRKQRIAMCMRATPAKKHVTVIKRRQEITTRIKGMRATPPPGAMSCDTMDVMISFIFLLLSFLFEAVDVFRLNGLWPSRDLQVATNHSFIP